MKKKIAIVGLLLLIVDLVTKILINKHFNLMETRVIIVDLFSITKVYNTGASWNILAGYRLALILMGFIMLGILLYYQTKFVLNNRNGVAFSLLYSGITGNLIDRIVYGYVIDFIDLKLFGYDFPVFNFADICIVMGIFLLIIAIFKKEDINEDISK